MGCNIVILMEVCRDGKNWELTKEKNEMLYYYTKKQIDKIKNDDEDVVRSIFDGSLTYLERELAEHKNTIHWVPTPRSYRLFAMLSNVRNYYGYHYLEDGELSDGVLSLPGNMSKEALRYFNERDGVFHSHTCLYGYEINSLKKIVEHNFEKKLIEETDKKEIIDLIEYIFIDSMKRFEEEGIKKSDMRFLIAYYD